MERSIMSGGENYFIPHNIVPDTNYIIQIPRYLCMSDEDDTANYSRSGDSCACDGTTDERKPGYVSVSDDTSDTMADVSDDTSDTMADVSDDMRAKMDECEDKLKRTMADYENMMRQKDHDIALRVAVQVDSILIDILQVRDDIERAHEAFTASGADASGLAGIVKNISAILARHEVKEIDALGAHFDPKIHESVSVVDDDSSDDETVIKVIRKGYICHERVLRPSLVEISRSCT